jgi:septum formation protein
MPSKCRWILASSSPRRIEMLKQLGFKFEISAPEVDESIRKGESARAMVARLSKWKASAVADKLKRESLTRTTMILAADTTVVDRHGKILGKPQSRTEANQMLSRLAGSYHRVFTGYTILQLGKQTRRWTKVVSTRVKVRALSAADCKAYVSQGESMDKAGGYAAQGLGMALIERVEGSYTNVVGLPMEQLLADLEFKFGIRFFSWRDLRRERKGQRGR